MRWYKRDPEAALRGMQILTLEERGAYNTILDLIYRSDNLLRDDDRFLAGHMGCDLRVWRRIKARLLELGKITLEAGYIRNVTASLVLSQAVAAADVNAIKGRKSGVARSKSKDLGEQKSEPKSNDKDIDRDIDRGKPPISPAQPIEPEPSPRGVAALKVEAITRKLQAGRWPEFREAYPKREGGQSWPAAEKKYTALVASGVAESDMIDGARGYSEHLKATGSYGSRFVKQALTWLNQKGWQDEYLSSTAKPRQSDLMDACDDLIRQAKARARDRAPGQRGGEGPIIDHDPPVTV